MASVQTSNAEIAGVLDRIADLLEAKGESPFRVSSYRHAASLVRESGRSFARLAVEQGAGGLRKVNGIGEKLAALILELVDTGKVGFLEELEKEAATPPEKHTNPRKPSSRPSGPMASGALTVKRGGPKAGRDTGTWQDKAVASRSIKDMPPIDIILDVDKEYRKKAEEGSLKLIAPKKLNPSKAAWLPILSTARDEWRFTVMFSNTALAHELGKTADWVVIYFKKEGEAERQCTVVTEHKGEMKGKRVVRGREAESQEFYR
jgi:DNA polymerase (family 10)